ncbi:ATP-dependent Clp protease ATP-binding subunit, partial [Candidatus Dojkabacteria bacterium]|nr:ATP-dependent Clp protease ATP-binding subunit [Candidatus Dojkabacteria bacterium]
MNPPEISQLSGLQRFTTNAKQAVITAHEIAAAHQNEEVLPVHLFLALIERPAVIIMRVFERANVDREQTRTQLLQELEKKRVVENNAPVFSEQIKDLINKSFLVAEKFGHVYVGSEHLLLAMLELAGEPFVKELQDLGLTPEAVSKIALEVGNYPPGILSQKPVDAGNEDKPFPDGDLPFFGRDMNEQAEKGEFLNITGRDEEIERLIHILSRKTKNNPILVGDAGVGKTAVVQGLAQRINRGEVPGSFIGKKVIALDISAVIAGARVRGDVEERILSLINEVIDSGDKILFIDEIHMIVGAGGQGRQDPMDIGNILKPYLTESGLRLIGATTMQEYRRYFDDDPALSRRFQPINVEELDKASATQVVNALKGDFEQYHGVKIKDDAIVEAVNLSDKFIADRYLPDKAIDLIDEAAASVKIGRELQIEPALAELGDKLLKVQRSKDLALENQDLKAAARFHAQEESITSEIADLIEGRHIYSPKRKVVDPEIIRKIVVDWTKIPIAAGNIDSEVLQKLDKKLGNIIVGQGQVLESVTAMLKRSHVGIGDSNRPLASFLFLGPTGVGKTALAKAIASELFGSGDLLYQINMSEFMEMHSVAKLIGSPPGYV